MRPQPGPHHDRPALPLTPQELATLADLEIRVAATRSGPRGRSWPRMAAIAAAAVLVVLVLVIAGALVGPMGVALGITAVVLTLSGFALHDLVRSTSSPRR
jgi:fatty acid desaturase